MSKLRKYKTVLHILHKELDVLPKKELEEKVKSIANFEGSASKATSQDLDNLITVVYLVADRMGVELKEDNKIKFNW